MFEVLLVLLIVFVAYSVHKHFEGSRVEVSETVKVPVMPANLVIPVSSIKEGVALPIKKPSKIKPTPLKKTVVKTTVATEKVVKPTVKKGLKNPVTGEIATSYANYRFAKRWIKEALVTEGLVEKVYKNNELDADIEALIKAALVKLDGLAGYQV